MNEEQTKKVDGRHLDDRRREYGGLKDVAKINSICHFHKRCLKVLVGDKTSTLKMIHRFEEETLRRSR